MVSRLVSLPQPFRTPVPSYLWQTIDFWRLPWSLPFRSICRWFTLDSQPVVGRALVQTAPWSIRPLFLQRWVAQAIAERFAWLEAHPAAERYRYARESEPRWEAAPWTRAEPAVLRACSEALLLAFCWIEVERLLRIANAAPKLVGQTGWTCAALSACEHLAQLYTELKRRYKAQHARAIIREELRRFVEWQGADGSPAD